MLKKIKLYLLLLMSLSLTVGCQSKNIQENVDQIDTTTNTVVNPETASQFLNKHLDSLEYTTHINEAGTRLCAINNNRIVIIDSAEKVTCDRIIGDTTTKLRFQGWFLDSPYVWLSSKSKDDILTLYLVNTTNGDIGIYNIPHVNSDRYALNPNNGFICYNTGETLMLDKTLSKLTFQKNPISHPIDIKWLISHDDSNSLEVAFTTTDSQSLAQAYTIIDESGSNINWVDDNTLEYTDFKNNIQAYLFQQPAVLNDKSPEDTPHAIIINNTNYSSTQIDEDTATKLNKVITLQNASKCKDSTPVYIQGFKLAANKLNLHGFKGASYNENASFDYDPYTNKLTTYVYLRSKNDLSRLSLFLNTKYDSATSSYLVDKLTKNNITLDLEDGCTISSQDTDSGLQEINFVQ